MKYILDTDILLPELKKMISEVASRAYSAEGTPLYDAIVPIDRDSSALKRFCYEAMQTLADRFGNDAGIEKEMGKWRLKFDSTKEGTITLERMAQLLLESRILENYTLDEALSWLYGETTYVYLPGTTTEGVIRGIRSYVRDYKYDVIYDTVEAERMNSLNINISTFDSTREASAQSAIEQYIIYTAVSKYLDERYPQGAKSYADRAAVMIEEVVRYMYQRLRPTARR